MVIELLDRGANPNHADSGRCRPIHRCLHHSWKVPESMYGTYAAIAGVLIARGAEYNIWVASGVGDVNGVKAMLQAEPNPNRLLRNRSPYVHDYVNPLWVACFHGHTDVVRLLLDAGADPDSPFTINVAGETVKQWGIRFGLPRIRTITRSSNFCWKRGRIRTQRFTLPVRHSRTPICADTRRPPSCCTVTAQPMTC